MAQQELSGIYLGNEGISVQTPKSKKEKEALDFFTDLNIYLGNTIQDRAEKEAKIKEIKAALKNSKLGQELIKLSKEVSQDKKLEADILSQRKGALGLLKNMKIDISTDIQNIKSLT